VELRPQMPFVIGTAPLAGLAKGLAWAGPGPRGAFVWPSSQSKSVGPYANAREEMGLREASNVIGLNLSDAARVHLARRDMPGCDKVPQPLRGEGINLVVVGRNHPTISKASAASDREGNG
jgi:hypothetical protein